MQYNPQNRGENFMSAKAHANKMHDRLIVAVAVAVAVALCSSLRCCFFLTRRIAEELESQREESKIDKGGAEKSGDSEEGEDEEGSGEDGDPAAGDSQDVVKGDAGGPSDEDEDPLDTDEDEFDYEETVERVKEHFRR